MRGVNRSFNDRSIVFVTTLLLALVTMPAGVVEARQGVADQDSSLNSAVTERGEGATGAPSDTSRFEDPVPVQEDHGFFSQPVQFSGSAMMNGDFYINSGGEARRPGATWMMTLAPRMTVLNVVELNVEALISTDQTEFRQNINQLGLNPSWRWVTLHIGDFSRNYTPFTVEGLRLRGGGVDLTPGNFHFSIQGGRAQRVVSSFEGEKAYKRNLIAARVGYGREGDNSLNLTLLTAKDNVGAEEQGLIVGDTLVLDTIPWDLRPETDTRPQANLAVGLDGQLSVFERFLTLRGEVAASLITHDLLADTVDLEVDDSAIHSGLARRLSRFHPVRLSSVADLAYEVESTINFRGTRIRGGYEEVGAGYATLGQPQMMNDRRGYHLGGSGRLWAGRLGLSGQYRHQTNNLQDQRRNTVDRNTMSLNASIRPSDRVTATVGGVVTSMVNDAPSDSMKLDTRSFALTTNTAVQQDIFGLPGVISLGYGFQHTTDGNPLAQIPAVTTHNLTTAVQLPLSRTISLSPSVSGVLTQSDGVDEDQYNILVGFRGNGRFVDGNLRTSANLTQTVSQGRQIFAANAMVSYPVTWGTDLSASARFNRYSAFNQRPGFREARASVSLSRSF